MKKKKLNAAEDFTIKCSKLKCKTILADPPWQFQNRIKKT